MYRLQCIALCFFIYYATVDTASVSFIKRCKPDDVACIKASAIEAFPHFIAGLPELGLPPADPIVLDDVRADGPNLKLGFRNLKVTGIKDCKNIDFTRDLSKSTMTLSVECPILASGQYDLDGKLLTFSATGNGDFTIQTDKVTLAVTVNLKDVDIKGEKHWKVTGFNYKYNIIDKATITLKNLFDGDEARAKPIRDIIEHNPVELIKEAGEPIIKELINQAVNIVQKFFKEIPKSQLEES